MTPTALKAAWYDSDYLPTEWTDPDGFVCWVGRSRRFSSLRGRQQTASEHEKSSKTRDRRSGEMKRFAGISRIGRNFY